MVKSSEAIPISQGQFPTLSSGELHLWYVYSAISPSAIEKCKNALSKQELAKVTFFEFEQVRDSYIISQGTLRLLLSAYLNIPGHLLQLGRRNKGKPYSIDDPELYFNMSNTGSIVVIAFSRDGEVGIDIEQKRALPDLDELINRNFTSSEIKFINSKPKEKINRFFRFWTVKESYLKAIGEGMRLLPDSIEFSLEKDRIRQLSVKGIFEQEDWYFKEFSIGTDTVGTVSFASENTKIRQLQYF